MTKRESNDFNRIAGVYDTLVFLIFGKSLLQAQLHFLYTIPEDATVLIVGGGTGELLEALLKQKPACQVVYVDASKEMIALATKRVQHSPRVTFIQGTEQALLPQNSFQVIITNFYFDLFPPESLTRAVFRLRSLLAPGGMWLAADFAGQEKRWQRFLLKIMYSFFRMVSNIEASRLPDWQQQLRKVKLVCQENKLFYNGFINSTIFRDVNFSAHSPVDN